MKSPFQADFYGNILFLFFVTVWTIVLKRCFHWKFAHVLCCLIKVSPWCNWNGWLGIKHQTTYWSKKSDHIHPIIETALATSNTSHSIQNFNYLLQLHLWNSPSVSVRSPSTLYSSKTVTICMWHTNLCHPPCKHKNIWWKIFFLFWPICLEQLKHSATLILPPLFSKAALKTHLFNNYF